MAVKKITGGICAGAAVLLLWTGCSTLGMAGTEKRALHGVELLEKGRAERLAAASGMPFLFETEILPAPAQVEALWKGLADSGYDFSPLGELILEPVDERTWEQFSSSRDVELWFEHHAPKKGVLARWETAKGQVYLLVDRLRKTFRPYRALKVVDK